MSFLGKTAIVTGGASGIGRAAARGFGAHGAAVVIGDIDADGGEIVAGEIAERGGRAVFVPTDTTVPEDCENLIAEAKNRFGRVDYAFNNVGVADHQIGRATADVPVEVWRRTIELTLSSTFYCLRAEIPALLETGGGAIVNMASIAGLISFACSPGYVAAKHGIIGLTKSICNEYAAQGIRCNCVAPGFIETPAFAEDFRHAPEAREQLVSGVPMLRMGQPEEIAETVLWLCSPASSFVNGACIPVDGGYVVR
ncbi:MAG TPA: glucose 1-dehydrogenase [Rhizomicrobium sp.]|nr:glucose 1-dehydrogenase [Rhizomicrobium sp.]